MDGLSLILDDDSDCCDLEDGHDGMCMWWCRECRSEGCEACDGTGVTAEAPDG